jgi:hypothetical protein
MDPFFDGKVNEHEASIRTQQKGEHWNLDSTYAHHVAWGIQWLWPEKQLVTASVARWPSSVQNWMRTNLTNAKASIALLGLR